MSIALLDPLAKDYKENHKNCAYKNSRICGGFVNIIPFSVEEWAKWDEYASYSNRGIWYHDTIVMINVLSHCLNAQTVFEWINTHLKRGGYLVFHEPARDINPLETFDIGHPLSYTQAVIDDFLAGYTEVYRKGDYFIGVKK